MHLRNRSPWRWLPPLALLLILWPLVAASPAASPGPATVILVRHAEKEAVEGNDPPLSAAGRARAAALRDALASAGVGTILVTERQRTRQTAQPLAERLGIAPRVIGNNGDLASHLRAHLDALRSLPPGSTTLIVGHSNTVPALVRALGGEAPEALPDSVYDQIFVLRLDPPSRTATIRARYGAANPGAL